MIYSYCKKCKLESPGDVCQNCGKRAAAGSQRDVWSVAAVPLADGRAWLGALYALLAVAALLMGLVFGLEYLIAGRDSTLILWQSALPKAIIAIVPLGMAAVFLFLFLQGREVIVYVLDPAGAHLQTWHQPGKIKSWARLQSADPGKNVPQQDGSLMHLSQERHLIWQDVVNVKYKPQNAAIYLYHTPRCAPMILKLPAQEYDLAAEYVGRHCKKIEKK